MAEIVNVAADPEANIIFGAVVDEALGDTLWVTVVAAGFDATSEEVLTEQVVSATRHDHPYGVATPPRVAPESVASEPVPSEDSRQEPREPTGPGDELEVPPFLR